MGMILIYGPPASGKLTVAKELEKITNYSIFDNHKTINLLTNYFRFGSKSFLELNEKIKDLLYNHLIKSKTNLILTYCFTGSNADKIYLKKLIKKFENSNNKVYLVRLECNEETLYKRVNRQSRKKHLKLVSKSQLKERLKKHNYFLDIPNRKSLIIDNSKLSPKRAAKQIREQLRIR